MSPINRQLDMVHANEWSMKIAFASLDYRHVDQHFGAASRPVVYDVGAGRVTLLRMVEFPVANSHQTEKIAEYIHALGDYVTLFCVAIGEAVFHQLLQMDVRAEHIPDQTTILGLLQGIQLSWYEKAQRYSARQRGLQCFSRLLEEPAWWEELDPLP